MKLYITLFLIAISFNLFSQKHPAYLSPKPNSTLVSRESNIIIKDGREISAGTLKDNIINVNGSVSGRIKTVIELSDDGKTVIAQPVTKFAEGEEVTITYSGGINTTDGGEVAPFTYSFKVTPLKERIALTKELRALLDEENQQPRSFAPVGNFVNPNQATDSLPSDLPQINVSVNNNPAPGYLFMSVSTESPGVGFYLFILDKNGKYVKYKNTPEHYPSCFQTQPNGLITFQMPHDTYQYAGGGHSTAIVLDTNLTQIDTFQCGNGYLSDSHEFVMLPNGHVLMVAYDLQPVDMSQIVTGGNPGALVYGSIIQELDLQKRVIFQWRSWDAIPITDTYQNMKLAGFDYIHVNAMRMDYDGNILIMSRLLCEITKLNRQTGEIMWRMGGKQNEFTFINDNPANAPTYFTHPHGLTLLPNGNYLFFDNGLLHTPQYSRAVEYQVDEVNKTATLVWEYRNTPDIYAATQGSAQRLDNGNTLIGWGSAGLTGKPSVTEVTPDKQVVFELTLSPNTLSYRALKYPFRDFKPSAEVSKEDLQPGVQYLFNDAAGSTGVGVYFQQMTSGYNFMNIKRYGNSPKNMAFPGAVPRVLPFRTVVMQLGMMSYTAEVTFDSTYTQMPVDPSTITIWKRSAEGTGTFSALPTSYNPVTKKLSVITTGFGEFILGISQPVVVPSAPIPFAPKQDEPVNQSLPVTFGYSSLGITTGYHLAVSTDSLFATSVISDSTLRAGIFYLQNPLPETKYYWKARGKNELGWSGWSEVKSFYTTAPFISLTAPNGGQTWKKKSAYFITWNNNLPALINIDLLRDNVLYANISSLANNCGSYQWTIPDSIAADTTYKIKVTSATDSAMFDISESFFSIAPLTGIEPLNEIPVKFSLHQNYPNPFNPSTRIRFDIPEESRVTLTIYNQLGEQVDILVNESLRAGSYSAAWNAGSLPSGIYYCRLTAGNHVFVKKLLLVK